MSKLPENQSDIVKIEFVFEEGKGPYANIDAEKGTSWNMQATKTVCAPMDNSSK